MFSDGKTSDSGIRLSLRYLDLNQDADDNELGSEEDDTAIKAADGGSGESPSRGSIVVTPPPHLGSPSLLSPMSIGHLGLTPITPLGQHLAASLARSSVGSQASSRGDAEDRNGSHGSDDGEGEGERGTRQSKDALVRRLTELAQKLSHDADEPDQATLSLLHSKLDELDKASHRRHSTSPEKRRPSSLQVHSPEIAGGGASSSASSSSSSWMRSRFSDLSLPAKNEVPDESSPAVKKPAVDSFKIASEAEQLNAQLETLMANLKARQEESEHIHELLVTRAERAAQRIIFLQSRASDLESELEESDSDLNHLRLGLKAIEVQLPPDFALSDPELAQSIANWKHDYADLKKRRASRRSASFQEAASSLSSFVSSPGLHRLPETTEGTPRQQTGWRSLDAYLHDQDTPSSNWSRPSSRHFDDFDDSPRQWPSRQQHQQLPHPRLESRHSMPPESPFPETPTSFQTQSPSPVRLRPRPNSSTAQGQGPLPGPGIGTSAGPSSRALRRIINPNNTPRRNLDSPGILIRRLDHPLSPSEA